MATDAPAIAPVTVTEAAALRVVKGALAACESKLATNECMHNENYDDDDDDDVLIWLCFFDNQPLLVVL